MKYLITLFCIASFISCSPNKKIQSETSSPQKPVQNISLALSISKRQLYVMRGDEIVRSYPVAVGQAKYPTPVGSFNVHRIDWNPEWNPPPESDWTKDKFYTPPGDPANPMGRVRIVYRMPYTIHGAKEISSLGKA